MPALPDLGLLRCSRAPPCAASSVALSGLDEVRVAARACRSGRATRRRGAAAMPSASCSGSRSRRSLVFFVLFLEPSPLHAARVFFDRTVRFQVGRDSPFSIWDWGQYHARGHPEPEDRASTSSQALLVLGALALGVWPRRRSPLRMAAFTAVLLIGFELVLTHWSYLYLPWFFPFVALALIAPLAGDPPPEPARADSTWTTMQACAGFRLRRRARDGRRGGGVPRRVGARPPLVLGARPADRHARRTRATATRSSHHGPVPLPRLPRRLPAGRAAGVRRCRRSSATTTRRSPG